MRGSGPRGMSAGGVSAPGGMSAPGGGCLLSGGVYFGGDLPQCLLGYHLPPPREQNDKQVQKYYLGHNFVAAGKNESKSLFTS